MIALYFLGYFFYFCLGLILAGPFYAEVLKKTVKYCQQLKEKIEDDKNILESINICLNETKEVLKIVDEIKKIHDTI